MGAPAKIVSMLTDMDYGDGGTCDVDKELERPADVDHL